MEKTCNYCGEPFVSKRKTAIYCSPSHRIMAFNRAKNAVLKSVNLGEPKKIFRQQSDGFLGNSTTKAKAALLAKAVGCEIAANVPPPVRTAESLTNERLGVSVADFCNQNNCTWDDVKSGYLASLKPIKAKIIAEKASELIQQKPKSLGGGYDRRATKLGF